ncbi:hypothetical protein [Spirosoma sordidisoli]|uniref:Uncharacterized protein n=1 Tax=Spirosoma sordidisoli TaxID=2502893 RepID=A0A4V1RW45_9BACT|nr:hypothetical protein [Spirosoma sordidisoli]RYC68988.1 hypothetical protein EQG79_16435 [Spirosoma sordidisoli]
MHAAPTPPSSEEAIAALLTCRQENQRWTAALSMNEADIDGLLGLLADLLEQPAYQSVHSRAVRYYGQLFRLKGRFRQIRSMYLCTSSTCGAICHEKLFGRHEALPLSFSLLNDEFNTVRATCYQFLSGLVRLNLI